MKLKWHAISGGFLLFSKKSPLPPPAAKQYRGNNNYHVHVGDSRIGNSLAESVSLTNEPEKMSTPRPGSDTAKELFLSEASCSQWSYILSRYEHAINILSKSKRKPELVSLDQFWRHEYPSSIKMLPTQLMSQKDLSRIMEWKLIRGKFRPLQKLCDSNGDAAVKSASQKAFVCMAGGNKDWKAAMKSLSTLKGIGEATASAVLAPLFPEHCPFMADEVLDVTCGRRDYTAKAYAEMRSALVEKANSLGDGWTAEDVGRALWTRAVFAAHGEPIDISIGDDTIEPQKGITLEATESGESRTSSKNSEDQEKDSKRRNLKRVSEDAAIIVKSSSKRSRR